jgi:hypothetical protein
MIDGGVKFPIFDNAVGEKTNNAINQGSNDGHLGNTAVRRRERTGGLRRMGKSSLRVLWFSPQPSAMQTIEDSAPSLSEFQE